MHNGPSMRTYSLILVLLLAVGGLQAQGKKLTAEEIIAKHLQSIGKSESIANAKQRMAVGSSEFTLLSSSTKANGRAVLASNGTDLAMVSTFNLTDYKMERIGIFGNKINIPFIVPGQRSSLGGFLNTYNKVLNDRIFGGSIFSTWIFLEPEGSKGKLEVDGMKKLDGRDTWVINYIPKGGLTSGSSIKIYFDAENFHHLRTVYRQKDPEGGFYDTGSKASNMGSVPEMGGQVASNGTTLTETFGDYREEAGITLPHQYSIHLSADRGGVTRNFQYTFNIEEYKILKNFPADFFTFKDAIAG